MNKKCYIDSLFISEFRGIKNLNFAEFNKINLIVGNNNAGKTSVLECLRIIGDPSIESIYNIGRRETNSIGGSLSNLVYLFPVNHNSLGFTYHLNGEKKNFLMNYKLGKTIFNSSIFNNSDDDDSTRQFKNNFIKTLNVENKEIDKIYGTINDDGKIQNYSKLKYDFLVSNILNYKRKYNIIYSSPSNHFRGNDFIVSYAIKNQDYKKSLLSILKLFDPNIIDIISAPLEIKIAETELNLVFNDKRVMPLKYFGDGIKKVISLAGKIADAKDGVLLIDEIETSLHHSMLENVFYFLIKASQQLNVQLFITTHSKEAIDTLVELDAKYFNNITSVFTLRKKDDISYLKTNFGKNLYELFLNSDFEIRD